LGPLFGKLGRRKPNLNRLGGANHLGAAQDGTRWVVAERLRTPTLPEPNLRQPILSAGDLALLDDLRPVYADFLASLPWDFFLTTTFRDGVPMRRQESVTHAVGQSIKAYFENVDRLALFAEPHLSQNLHLHGLVSLSEGHPIVKSATKDSLQARLTDSFGWSKVEIPRGHQAVSKYVAKYCVKTDGYYELW